MTRSSSGNLRSHALRTMTERQSQNQSSDRLSRTTIVSEAEAVEPIDYEEYVSQHSEQRDSLSRHVITDIFIQVLTEHPLQAPHLPRGRHRRDPRPAQDQN